MNFKKKNLYSVEMETADGFLRKVKLGQEIYLKHLDKIENISEVKRSIKERKQMDNYISIIEGMESVSGIRKNGLGRPPYVISEIIEKPFGKFLKVKGDNENEKVLSISYFIPK